MQERILVIEDEEKIARLLEMELSHEGYLVEYALTGRDGMQKAVLERWDVILLDIMLPEISGLEVLRRLRHADEHTPIILLTARGTTPDKVSGLDLGASDYITKPFEIEELLARIRACIRNSKVNRQVLQKEDFFILVLDDLTMNTGTREVKRGSVQIELTPKEFDLLYYLVVNRNLVLTREQIISDVWGYDFVGETNIVDVYIRYIRRKMDYPFPKQLIQTIRGVGYCIRESVK